LVTVVAFLAAHLVLGVAGYLVPLVATAHAGLVALALAVAIFWGRRVDRLVAVTAYGALCDVFWRMTESRAPWEFSKYLLLAGSLAVLVRYARRWRRSGLPVAFLACLAAGVVATILAQGPGAARETISFAEMGLISLGVAALAFRQLVATESDAWNLGWVLLGPVVCALAITTWSTLTSGDLAFNDESNFAVTGGFGPNQVSTVLGLGILVCVLLAFQRRGSHFLALLAGLALWSTWAAFLTFSRGGVYSLVLAGAGLLLVGVGTRGARVRSLVTGGVAVVGLLLMFASANDFTGNWLDSRYSSGATATAGRTSLVEQDLDLWGRHPLWGVGSGQSSDYHEGGNLTGAAAHTEYTRMLAEHGLFGLVAIALLVAMVVGGFRASRSQWNRLMVAGLGVWAVTAMLHAATRVGAVSLVFALTQLRVEPDPSPSAGSGRSTPGPVEEAAPTDEAGLAGTNVLAEYS
jgi:O-antigen ligase